MNSNKRTFLWVWLFSLGYTGVYHWSYCVYLYPVWGYLGFLYVDPPPAMIAAGYAFASAGALFLRNEIKRPSDMILWVIYLMVYVPSMLTPVFLHLSSDANILALMTALLAGLAIISFATRIRLVASPLNPIPVKLFMLLAGIVTVSLLTWVILIYRGQFSLVAFDKVYDDVRFAGSAIEYGTGVTYAIGWLSYFLFPLVIAIALNRRNWILFLLGASGIVLMYSTSGLRGVMVAIVTLPAAFFFLSMTRRPTGIMIACAVATLIAILTTVAITVDTAEIPGLQTTLSLVLMRTSGTTGYLTGLYYDFFSSNPLTHFTHLKIFSLAGISAYNEHLGVVIGRTYTSSSEVCMNANFWASDGIAALGLPGIPVISAMVGAVLYVVDVVSQRHRLEMVMVSLIPIVTLMCNISFFTLLLSGGLGFWILTMFVMPPEIEGMGKRRKHGASAQMGDGFSREGPPLPLRPPDGRR